MSTRVMKKFESVADGIDNMVAAAKYDYTLSNFNDQMNEEFANSFMIKQGQKYRGNVLEGGFSISWTGPHYLI